MVSTKERIQEIEFMMIVSKPSIASYISKFHNVTIFVDLEYLGKYERQGHLDTVKTSLKFDDVKRIREAAPSSNILVRINPLNKDTEKEVDSVIANGADSIMLPMFSSLDEIKIFIEIVNNRVKVVPLFETSKSIEILPEIISKLRIEQIHIGLNDLHLDQGKNFLFEPLSDGFLEESCRILRKSKIKFGIGGIARAGQGLLSPEFILGEHVRLGSSVAILSRAFHNNADSVDKLKNSINFGLELKNLEKIYMNFRNMDKLQLEKNKLKTWKLIKQIAKKSKNNNIS